MFCLVSQISANTTQHGTACHSEIKWMENHRNCKGSIRNGYYLLSGSSFLLSAAPLSKFFHKALHVKLLLVLLFIPQLSHVLQHSLQACKHTCVCVCVCARVCMQITQNEVALWSAGVNCFPANNVEVDISGYDACASLVASLIASFIASLIASLVASLIAILIASPIAILVASLMLVLLLAILLVLLLVLLPANNVGSGYKWIWCLC